MVTLYTYGSNGELKTKTDSATGAQTRYQYDALGNLLKVVLPTGDSVEYLMDGQNRRVGRKWNGAVTHRWLYQNQLNPIAELDSAGALVSRFVYGSRANVPDYLLRAGAVYRLVTDHLGSVRAVVDTATGAVAQWTAYDAWGNVLADSGAGFQPFGFAGGMADSATGLVRFGARDYDPAVGRWTAKDPVGFGGGQAAFYTYVGNEAVNVVDPTGLAVAPVVWAAFVAASAAASAAIEAFAEYVCGGSPVAGGIHGAQVGLSLSTVMAGGGLAASGAVSALAGRGLVPTAAASAPWAFDPRVAGQLNDPRLGNLAGRLTQGDIANLLANPGAQRMLDVSPVARGYGPSINVVQDVAGVMLRITVSSTEMRVYSVGPIGPNAVTNGIARGRFFPLP
ncbi:MAG: RHS repeat-associated core domain-containing protein [Gemmatimonadetes bacterium]|nr:RHS repeat-associated core domain-containing protein [Gemmatimonadota bacterium]